MGRWWEAPDLEFVDSGRAPEYFVDAIARQELLEGGNVRSYVCSRRGKLLILQYTSVVPISCLAVMGRRVLQLSADHHNGSIIREKVN